MRRILLLSLIAGSLIIPAGPAVGDHAPKSFCSESGDVCLEIRERDTDFIFRLALSAEHFTRYRICVKDPDGVKECGRFRVRENSDGSYGSKVSWMKNFPDAGPGAYTVLWKFGGGALGDKLGFHVPN